MKFSVAGQERVTS